MQLPQQMKWTINRNEEHSSWKYMHSRSRCIMKHETSRNSKCVFLIESRCYFFSCYNNRKFTMLVMQSDRPFHIQELWVSSRSAEERCGWANVCLFDVALRGFPILKYISDIGQWNRASEDFFESFRNYDEAGSPQRIQVLKYLVLANMLTGSEVNPFDSQETKP